MDSRQAEVGLPPSALRNAELVTKADLKAEIASVKADIVNLKADMLKVAMGVAIAIILANATMTIAFGRFLS